KLTRSRRRRATVRQTGSTPLTIPIPIPRGVPGRLLFQVFGAFRGLRRDKSGSAPPCPLRVVYYGAAGFTWMLRTGQLLPLKGFRRWASTPEVSHSTPPACYGASWQLPRPDSHRLVGAFLCVDSLGGITSPECPRRWARF